MQTHSSPHESPALFATGAGGSLAWAAVDASAHGLQWTQVAPILFGVSSLVMAVRAYLNDRQTRRHADADHAAKAARPFAPRVEELR